MRVPIAAMAVGAFLLGAISASLSSCRQTTQGEKENLAGDTIELRYARHLTLVQRGEEVEAIIRNPWDTTKVLLRYLINKPLKRAVVFSAVHCALFEELRATDCIKGVCDAPYISSKTLQKGIKSGKIRDLGSSYQPNIELLAATNPDALLPSGFENAGSYAGTDRLGIPLIPCVDYMEQGPLARAEWMKFFGRLVGKGDEADSLFSQVEQRYLALKQKAEQTTDRPTLLSGYPYQGTWYVPGGQSSMGMLYADAGVQYVYADTPATGSLPMNIENVLSEGHQANIWLFVYNQPRPITQEQIASENRLLTQFDAYANGGLRACNAAQIAFHELTPFHPDFLLEDILAIAHPELGVKPRYEFYKEVK